MPCWRRWSARCRRAERPGRSRRQTTGLRSTLLLNHQDCVSWTACGTRCACLCMRCTRYRMQHAAKLGSGFRQQGCVTAMSGCQVLQPSAVTHPAPRLHGVTSGSANPSCCCSRVAGLRQTWEAVRTGGGAFPAEAPGRVREVRLRKPAAASTHLVMSSDPKFVQDGPSLGSLDITTWVLVCHSV